MATVALLPAGSVSDEAAKLLFQYEDVDYKYHRLISDVFLSTVNEVSQYSVIPIENTIDGSVSLHMDWLVHEVDLPIQAEWIYPSNQNFIGRKSEIMNDQGEYDFTKVKKVISHPVAMSQCMKFIREYIPNAEREHVSSTAESVRIVKENPLAGVFAIGTKTAAKNNELDVLMESVTDHQNNYTRFFLVGNKPYHREGDSSQMRTSILVTLPEDFPGALHQVLSAFAWRRINLSRIESRPTKRKLGSYYFYIELKSSINELLLQRSLEEIEAIGCHVRVLGSYPCFTYDELVAAQSEK